MSFITLRVRLAAIALLFFTTAIASSKTLQSNDQPKANKEVQITTSSTEARKLFLKGREARENWHLPEALDAWRAATQKDPKFALAQVYVSHSTGNQSTRLGQLPGPDGAYLCARGQI